MNNETEKKVHRVEGILGRILAVATLVLLNALVVAGIASTWRWVGGMNGQTRPIPSSTEEASG